MSTGRVLLYGRVSADRLGGRSVDSQLDEGRRWADRENMHVVGVFRDDGVSASRYSGGKARPGWQDTMTTIAAGEADVLWAWEISRATRDRSVWAALFAACQDAGVAIAVNGRMHDLSDPEDSFSLDLMAALAVRESSQTSRRVLRAVSDRAARGRPHGPIRDGYKSEYDPHTGGLVRRVIDPERAAVVREAVGRVLAGESCYAVAADLNRRGNTTSTGKPWRGGNLATLLRSPTYVARRVFRGKDVGPGDWEPILTGEEHHRLLALFADPERAKYRQDTRVKNLLVGIATCGKCGSPMRVVRDARKPVGRQQKYVCRGPHVCVTRLQAPVDDLIERLVVARLSQPDVLEVLSDPGDDDEVRAAAAEVAALQEQLREAREKVDTGELTLDDLAYFRVRWEPRLQDAEQRGRTNGCPQW